MFSRKRKLLQRLMFFDNFDFMNVVVYARNAVYDIAKEKGYKWFIVLDDDYRAVEFTIDGKYFNFLKSNATLDYVFLETFNFFEKTNLKIFSWAQGADLFIVKHICKRKAMNVFFCSTERRVKFLGKINEDVNMFSRYNQLGDMMFTIPIVSIEQKQTQTHTGMTEAYLAYGTYHKSFYSVIQCPSFIKVCVYPYSGSNCHTQNRIHHIVDVRHGYPCLISSRYKKEV